MDAEKGLCLPLLEDLTPLTQILISPELASAFSLADRSAKSHASFSSLSSIQQQSSSSHPYSCLPFAAKARGITTDTQTANGDLGHGGISLGPFASTTAGFNPGAALQQGGIDLNKMTESASLPLQQGMIDLNKNAESGSMPPMMNGLPYGAYERKAESSYGVGAGGGGSDSSNGGGGQPKRARTHHEAAEGAESEEGDSGGGLENSGEDLAARTLKRPRLVWTPQLHKRFVDAVAHLGIKNAVPKTIMQLMNVEGLTRENVASHLQKYRLYLKRMQGLTSEGPSVSDHLFASTPIPPALAASPSFLPAAHREDIVAIPFVPPMVPLVIPGLTPAHMGAALAYGGFDHHPYAAIMQANAKRFATHEYRELGMDSQAPSTSPQRPILTLFPTSSH